MRLGFALGAIFALAGCGGQLPPPEIRVERVEIDRPVAVSCVKAEDIPAIPARVGDQLTGDAVRDLDLIAANALRLRAALDQAVALLVGCKLKS